MKATIPFTFVVGSKELKAGEYLIQQVGSPGSQSLQFRSEDGDFEQTATKRFQFCPPCLSDQFGFYRITGQQPLGQQAIFLFPPSFVGPSDELAAVVPRSPDLGQEILVAVTMKNQTFVISDLV